MVRNLENVMSEFATRWHDASTSAGKVATIRLHYPTTSGQMAASPILPLRDHWGDTIASSHKYFRFCCYCHLLKKLSLW